MVWQEAFPPTGGPAFDAEGERERRLAAQARAGAEWALTALIARYQPTVVRYLTRLCGNQAQARRLAERIFQRMERRLHGPHGAENLRLWLLRASTEAGLDALRRPNGAPIPRLTTSGVAGLLTEESGQDTSGFLQSGLRRLRQATGGPSRQARPLVWAEDPAAQASAAASGEPARPSSESHLDETLDRLDPRDALRHRLVRVTLAELPYGDAQCLALHLVAGLNQAEVAKALGITNSAARKRMVHGLALFSERYALAVQSLGLPVELGFGDAIPRSVDEPESVAEPEPEPVVVSSQAPDAAASARGEDRIVESDTLAERSRDALSGVAYLSEDSGETVAISSEQRLQPEPHHAAPYADLFGGDEQAHQLMGAAHADGTTQPSALLDEHDPAPVSSGLITRVASDAIIGPIVDALPVTATSPETSGVFERPGPRSMPLAYELSTRASQEPSGFRMNWLDDAGMMTPLTFEAVAVSSAEAAPAASAHAADAPLTLEALAFSVETAAATGASDEAEGAPMAYELAQATTSDGGDEAEPQTAEPALAQLAAEPLALVAEPLEPQPISIPVLSATTADPGADDATDDAALFAPRPSAGVITRSLEDIWDELPDSADL